MFYVDVITNSSLNIDDGLSNLSHQTDPGELSDIILHGLENNGHSRYYIPGYDKQAVR